jgi:protein O-GlcNAc transferase
VLIHDFKSRRDAFSARLEAMADRVVVLPNRIREQQAALAEQQLDVLFYPDIGMSSSTYFLAFSRLAPVQLVSWGHPDTTGLDSMDYFLSARPIEPPGAAAHYSERLVLLERLPCFYEPVPPPARATRADFGLPESGALYGCPQSLFKLHPDFDEVLAAIAAGDPDGRIVLLEGTTPEWSDLLRRRWKTSHPALLERVVFLPRQPQARFMSLMALFDLLLDPVHFGSGNTLYDAMRAGTPIVTWPGEFMRGRVVAGAYAQMGIVDAPIAARIEEFAPLALSLAHDRARLAGLRESLPRAAERELFADLQAMAEFEAFLAAAVEAARQGDKLAADWRPAAGPAPA